MVALRLSDRLRDQLSEHRDRFGPLLVVECVPYGRHAVGYRRLQKAQLLHGSAPAVSAAAEHPQPEVDAVEHPQRSGRAATARKRPTMRAEAASRRAPVVARLAGQSRRPVLASAYHPEALKSVGARHLGVANPVRRAPCPRRRGADARRLLASDIQRDGGGQSVEWFFDRVNHDVLMARVARQVSDGRVLKLIRRFLVAGMMRDGVVEARTEGTPQGGPLSPLLSN